MDPVKDLREKASNCDPVNYYCVNPSDEDKGIIQYYAAQTGIPGPLVRSKPIWEKATAKPMQGPAAVRNVFQESQHLRYAFPELKQMRAAPYMPGPEIQKYNIEDNPFGPAHLRRSIQRDVPNQHMEYTPMWTPVERCGCGPSPVEKKK